MDHRHPHQDEQSVVAERAAEWLTRLKTGGTQEKRSFVRWLRRSPEHAGEMLLATSTDIVLRQFFRGKKIDALQEFAVGNPVIELATAESQAPRLHRSRARWPWVAGLSVGMAAAVTAFIVQPAFVRDWLHPNLYT